MKEDTLSRELWLLAPARDNLFSKYSAPVAPGSTVQRVKLPTKGPSILKVAEHKGNFLLVDSLGKVYSAGQSNAYGVLGRNSEQTVGLNHNLRKDSWEQKIFQSTSSLLKRGQPLDELKQITELDPFFVVDVALASNHCLALTRKGEVFSWGYALDGALGYELSNLEACSAHPQRIPLYERIERLFIGPQNSAFSNTDGRLFACGQFTVPHTQRQQKQKVFSQCVELEVSEQCDSVSFSEVGYCLILTKTGRLYETGSTPRFQGMQVDDDNYSAGADTNLSRTNIESRDSRTSLASVPPAVRVIQELSSEVITKMSSGRISVALTIDNVLFLWDCLVPNFLKISLTSLLSSTSTHSLSLRGEALFIHHTKRSSTQESHLREVVDKVEIGDLWKRGHTASPSQVLNLTEQLAPVRSSFSSVNDLTLLDDGSTFVTVTATLLQPKRGRSQDMEPVRGPRSEPAKELISQSGVYQTPKESSRRDPSSMHAPSTSQFKIDSRNRSSLAQEEGARTFQQAPPPMKSAIGSTFETFDNKKESHRYACSSEEALPEKLQALTLEQSSQRRGGGLRPHSIISEAIVEETKPSPQVASAQVELEGKEATTLVAPGSSSRQFQTAVELRQLQEQRSRQEDFTSMQQIEETKEKALCLGEGHPPVQYFNELSQPQSNNQTIEEMWCEQKPRSRQTETAKLRQLRQNILGLSSGLMSPCLDSIAMPLSISTPHQGDYANRDTLQVQPIEEQLAAETNYDEFDDVPETAPQNFRQQRYPVTEVFDSKGETMINMTNQLRAAKQEELLPSTHRSMTEKSGSFLDTQVLKNVGEGIGGTMGSNYKEIGIMIARESMRSSSQLWNCKREESSKKIMMAHTPFSDANSSTFELLRDFQSSKLNTKLTETTRPNPRLRKAFPRQDRKSNDSSKDPYRNSLIDKISQVSTKRRLKSIDNVRREKEKIESKIQKDRKQEDEELLQDLGLPTTKAVNEDIKREQRKYGKTRVKEQLDTIENELKGLGLNQTSKSAIFQRRGGQISLASAHERGRKHSEVVSDFREERKLTKSMIPPSSRASTQLMASISNINKKYQSYQREEVQEAARGKSEFRKKSWKELKQQLINEYNQSQANQPKALMTDYDSKPSAKRAETKTPSALRNSHNEIYKQTNPFEREKSPPLPAVNQSIDSSKSNRFIDSSPVNLNALLQQHRESTQRILQKQQADSRVNNFTLEAKPEAISKSYSNFPPRPPQESSDYPMTNLAPLRRKSLTRNTMNSQCLKETSFSEASILPQNLVFNVKSQQAFMNPPQIQETAYQQTASDFAMEGVRALEKKTERSHSASSRHLSQMTQGSILGKYKALLLQQTEQKKQHAAAILELQQKVEIRDQAISKLRANADKQTAALKELQDYHATQAVQLEAGVALEYLTQIEQLRQITKDQQEQLEKQMQGEKLRREAADAKAAAYQEQISAQKMQIALFEQKLASKEVQVQTAKETAENKVHLERIKAENRIEEEAHRLREEFNAVQQKLQAENGELSQRVLQLEKKLEHKMFQSEHLASFKERFKQYREQLTDTQQAALMEVPPTEELPAHPYAQQEVPQTIHQYLFEKQPPTAIQSNLENLNSVQFDISQSVRDESQSVMHPNGRISSLEGQTENPHRGLSIVSSEGYDHKVEEFSKPEPPLNEESSQQSTDREETQKSVILKVNFDPSQAPPGFQKQLQAQLISLESQKTGQKVAAEVQSQYGIPENSNRPHQVALLPNLLSSSATSGILQGTVDGDSSSHRNYVSQQNKTFSHLRPSVAYPASMLPSNYYSHVQGTQLPSQASSIILETHGGSSVQKGYLQGYLPQGHLNQDSSSKHFELVDSMQQPIPLMVRDTFESQRFQRSPAEILVDGHYPHVWQGASISKVTESKQFSIPVSPGEGRKE